jgi:hypothetical protein
MHFGQVSHSTRVVKASSPVGLMTRFNFRDTVAGDLNYCFLSEGERGADCAARSVRAECDPYFRITSPQITLIMTANLSSSISAVCRQNITCWIVVISVTIFF